MKKLIAVLGCVVLVGLSSAVLTSTAAFAEGPTKEKPCRYNEFDGEVTFAYSAHDGETARGSAPTSLTFCKNAEGSYMVYSYKAVGLGNLFPLPLPLLKSNEVTGNEGDVSTYIGSTDESDAFTYLNAHPTVQALVLFGDSKEQIVMYRRQQGRIVSNTLFLNQ